MRARVCVCVRVCMHVCSIRSHLLKCTSTAVLLQFAKEMPKGAAADATTLTDAGGIPLLVLSANMCRVLACKTYR